MRTPILLCALLFGAALATLPSASADPACTTDLCGPDPNEPPTCLEKTYAGGIVTVHEDCSVDVVTGPEPASASSAVPPCACPAPAPLCRPINEMIADNDDGVDFTLSDSCHPTASIDLTYYLVCLYGSSKTVTVGPVSVTYPTDCSPPPCGGGLDYCPPPTEAAGLQQQVPPCACPPPPALCDPLNRILASSPYYSIDDYCNVTITLEAYCGLQGYPEDHQVKVPKLTVNFQTCKYVPPPQS